MTEDTEVSLPIAADKDGKGGFSESAEPEITRVGFFDLFRKKKKKR